MKTLLESEYSQLHDDIKMLIHQIDKSRLPPEMSLYRKRLIESCTELEEKITNYLIMVEFAEQTNILSDLISELQKIKTRIQLFSAVLAPPVLRATGEERLSLAITNWLHQQHPQTSGIGAAITNGRWQVHLSRFLAVYYVPILEQNRLLNLPLFFHEFGHILYQCHRPEMDNLVKDLQVEALDLLQPARRRNDAYDKQRAEFRKAIAATWYKWMAELFCDAVGFEMGGPSYIKAFSAYLRHFQYTDFYLDKQQLKGSSHPVTWLRIHFLAERARRNGFSELSNEVQQTWQSIADALRVIEDYSGFYDNSLKEVVTETLDNMLIEAYPQRFDDDIVDANEVDLAVLSPVHLLNVAWRKYENSPQNYPSWETNIISQYIDATHKYLTT